MDVLIRFGFSIEEIKNIMDANGEINDISDEQISELIEILKQVGCLKEQIKNVFIANPFYLSRNVDEVKKLIVKLCDIGLDNLQIIFESNPYLLNVNYKEIDDICKSKKKEGLSDDEIIEYFYSYSYKIL